jgi:tRNA-guanine transglycosylase
MFRFRVLAKDTHSKARVGELMTPHGVIKTPNFNPVGTQATVKTLSSVDLAEIGAQIVLSNTYHLVLRPGSKVIQKMGGLAKFMGWGHLSHLTHTAGDARQLYTNTRESSRSLSESRQPSEESFPKSTESTFSSPAGGETPFIGFPTMTDSGGFQVFSLGVAHKQVDVQDRHGRKMSKFSKSVFLDPADLQFQLPAITKTRQEKELKKFKEAIIHEDGVWFYSHIDGSKRWFDADVSIAAQEELGADLIVAFDDHESPLWDYETTKISLERTNRWGLASLAAQKRNDQLMYGVVHGGVFSDLRISSAQFVDRYFPAIAIGGSYTSKEVLYQVIDWVVPHFSEDKPRHLLGIGEVQDLFEAVSKGMDFFDCVAPTRRGRHGNVYISPENGGRKERSFVIQLTNAQYTLDEKPIDPGCACYTCRHFSRAYLHHLFKANELLAQRLGSYHNVYFIVSLVKKIREAILEERFLELKEKWIK